MQREKIVLLKEGKRKCIFAMKLGKMWSAVEIDKVTGKSKQLPHCVLAQFTCWKAYG